MPLLRGLMSLSLPGAKLASARLDKDSRILEAYDKEIRGRHPP